jgi:hypothetical protein
MSYQSQILARFSGEPPAEPLYLPDLSLWYDWHQRQGTLPTQWADLSLADLARAMGAPIWVPFRPWRVETGDALVHHAQSGDERIVQAETPLGTLVARWTLGPDGDWWQVEYPVKSAKDLPAALELVKARSYSLDPTGLREALEQVGEDGIVALELPRRPYSDLLHEFLGWAEGLMLLGDPVVQEMLDILESRLRHVVAQIAQLPGTVVLSPDNLDGQYISPRMFARHLAPSYQNTVSTLQPHDKVVVVHIGGPIRHLVKPLAEAGVHGLEGISGPPQSNTSLAEARQLAGPDLTLWGGIAQDYLQNAHDWGSFETAVHLAVQEAREDGRMILGIADRVPVNAELDRLEALPELVRQG